MCKDLNISLWYSDEAKALILKNNLRIILGSKLKKLRILRLTKSLVILINKYELWLSWSFKNRFWVHVFYKKKVYKKMRLKSSIS